MRKFSKVLFLLLMITMIVFTFSTTVKADNYDDYEELVDETTKQTPATTQTQTTTPVTTQTPSTTETPAPVTTQTPVTTTTDTNANQSTTNKANTATASHPQAGSVQNIVYIALGLITIVGILVGYSKVKKYNY